MSVHRHVDEILRDITYIDEADKRLLEIHDRVAGPGAAIPNGTTPLLDTDYIIVRDHLLSELGEAYLTQIHYGGK